MDINGREFAIIRLLGKGKGGYSYLVTDGKQEYVLKQIHHEPCTYYQFGNKLEAELNDYEKLKRIGIRVPELLEVDQKQERMLKEFIKGDTVYDLVKEERLPPECFAQIQEMCRLLYPAHTNIDYFPTNFVLQEGLLYYIDYECNEYMEEWNFENWGIRYWSKTEEFRKYEEEHT